MQFALITMLLQTPGDTGAGDGDPAPMLVGQLPFAGRVIALRQLELALAAGCEAIAVLAPADCPDMAALRARAEAGGAKLHTIANAHGLAPLVHASDTLLVFDDGAVPIDPAAMAALGEGIAILAVPADPAADEGFERIDRDRAWAGTMRIPGRLVERLQRHAADCDPASMLLRVALQAGVPMVDAPAEDWLAAWDRVGVQAAERDWLARRLPQAEPYALTDRAAAILFRRWGPMLLRHVGTPSVWQSAAIAALAAAGLALAASLSAGFGLLAIAAAFALFVLIGTARVIEAPDRPVRGRRTLAWGLDIAFILALVAGGAGPAGGGDLRADAMPDIVFAPLVLIVALRLLLPPRRVPFAALARDRVVLALALAVAYAVGIGPMGVQGIALACLLLAGL